MTLDQFPQFRVADTTVEDGIVCYVGTFEPTPKVSESWMGYLFTKDRGLARGRFACRPNSTTIAFSPWDAAQMELRIGESYAYIEGYWGEKAALVLDHAHRWERKEFQPQDAFEPEWSGRNGPKIWGKAAEHVGEPGRIIPAAWDHAHCAICWAKIAQYEQPYGYRSSDDDTWVCERCYTQYVEPRSLAFIRLA